MLLAFRSVDLHSQHRASPGGLRPCFLALLVLLAGGTAVPQAPATRAMGERLIGLLDVPGIYASAENKPPALTLYAQPVAGSTALGRMDAKGILSSTSDAYACTWTRDLYVPIENGQQAQPAGCIFSESGYEVPALAVFARKGSWFRVSMDNHAASFGWVQAEDEAFHSLRDLVANPDQLTYLTAAWDRRLFGQPGSRASVVFHAARVPGNTRNTFPYRVLASKDVQGQLWIKVAILKNDDCDPVSSPVVQTGWVPAASRTGALFAWFYSRGC